ncbi:tetratricopeptide repeat protein [Saccharopolyspora taberi]|uniref:Tetratricopeptide repeat protein n=1 Tax=Saccharopolyspora taberi TaxID=60895 RepID=A0ABN3VJ97_9PSEU
MRAISELDDIDLLRRRCRFAEAEQALSVLEDSAEVRVLRGRMALDRERGTLALEHFEKAVELDPASDVAVSWRVAALERVYRYADSEKVARQGLETFPDSVRIRIALGCTFLRMQRLEDGLEQFDSARAVEPRDLDVLECRVIGLRRLGRFEEAGAAVEEALRIHPDHPDLLFAAGRVHAVQGRPADALVRYEEALRADPWHNSAWDHKISVLRLLSRFEEAEDAVTEAIHRFPGSVDFRTAQAMLALDQDQHDEALTRIEQALAIDPEYPPALQRQLDLLYRADRLPEAEAAAASALARCPDDPGLLLEQAWLFRRLGRTGDALELATRAAEIDQYCDWAYITEAFLLRVTQRLPEAERRVRESLRLLPFSPGLRLQLAYVLHDQRRFAEEEDEIRRALETEPVASALHRQRTALLRSQNRHDDVVDEATATAGRFPQDPDFCYELGRVHLARDEHSEALRRFEQTLDIAPAHGAALESRVITLRIAGKLNQAEHAAREGLRKRPRHHGLHEELALVQDRLGQHQEVLATLRNALSVCGGTWYLRYRLVQQYLTLGRYEEALSETDIALEREPLNARAMSYRIHVLTLMRRLGDAESAVTRGIELFPDDQWFLRRAAWLDTDRGRFDAALDRLRELWERNPADVFVLIEQVRVLRHQRRYEDALALLRRESGRFPESAVMEKEIATTLRLAGRYDEALEHARRARERDPFGTSCRVEEISVLRESGRYPEAEQAALEAAKAEPSHSTFPRQLGEIRDETNRFDQALEWFDRALDLDPFGSATTVAKSATLRSLRRFAEAEQLVRTALERFPLDRSLRGELGWILRDQERCAEAESAFEALRDDAVGPVEASDAWYGLGWVSLSQGRYDDAEYRFRYSLRELPCSDESRLGLAWTYLRSGNSKRYDEVSELCLAVLRDDPRDHVAHLCLGVLSFRRNEYPVAEHHLKRSIELHPHRGSYVDLGAFYGHLGRFDEAEELLKKALDRDWYDVHAHIQLGNLHLQRDLDAAEPGEWASLAVQRFRQAIVISPGSAAAAIGLSTALWRASGDLVSAEDALRFVLKRPDCDRPRWQVQLALARLLVQRGDDTQRDDLHQEALSVATDAIELASREPEPYFVAGVAAYKIGEGADVQARPLRHRVAVRYLKKAVRLDPGHAEAHRVLALAKRSLRVTRTSVLGSAALIGLSLVLLVVLWGAFLLRYQVTTVMMATLTPVLTAMVAVGFLLPFLVRLKLPGLEADLSASLNQVSAGPTGEVSLGPGRFAGRGTDNPPSHPVSLSEGPSGALPRLG